MKILKERILSDGEVLPGDILKVDSFLNHQLDIDLLNEIGREFHRRFVDAGITKILTIEASGIAVAAITAQYFGVPVVFAKKSKSANAGDDAYTSEAESFTRGRSNPILVSRKYLSPADNVLIIDDFLANGSALGALIDITSQAGAKFSGIGIVIEKGYMDGGRRLREMGYRIESLAIIAQMNDQTGEIRFRDEI